MTALYLEHTPIECCCLDAREVFVKRDDLYARPPAPPIAKMRGLRAILERVDRAGGQLVGCFEASQSRIGHGLAAACTEYPDLRCIVAFPRVKNRPLPQSVLEAERLGARTLPIPSNIVAISYRQAARVVSNEGGWMIPFGFECPEAIQAVEEEARRLPRHLVHGGTLVVACGSGVTLAGLLRGLRGQPARIIGVSVGRSVENIRRCLARHVDRVSSSVEIRPPTRRYRDRPPIDAPFPCDARYDLKAWEVIVHEIASLRDPVLFWNVGG
jgi:1-aminocyclopropane-1-carboxylate deaminase/D-cysteine desulfhydrase-like pyridoxal-dependent ACC family enzyme